MADAPSHTDVSVLYLPLMPETSKLGEAMVQAGKDATESFGKGSSGIGDKIHESFSKSKDKIKDVFHRSGSDAAEAMADGVKEKSSAVEDAVAGAGEKAKGKFRESAKDWGKILVDAVGPDTKKLLGDRLEETVGSALEGVLGDNAKWAGKFSHTVADWGFDELKNKLGGVSDAAKTTKAAFADITSGNTTQGVSKLVDSFGKLGVEAKDLPQPLQDVAAKMSEGQRSAEEFAGIFKDLPGKIGLVGTAIEALGPIVAGAMGGFEVIKQFINAVNHFADAHPQSLGDAARTAGIPVGPLPGMKQPSVLPFLTPPNAGVTPSPGDIPGMMLPTAPTGPRPAAPVGPGSWFGGGPSNPVPVPSTPAPSIPTPSTPSGSGTGDIPSSFIGSSSTSASSPAELHASGSRVANLYRVAQALQGTPYSQALRNDCSGMVSKLATAALGMSPSVQFSTVNEGDWLMSHGFQPGVGPAGSFQVGWYDHGGGNAGHTAATLPNGMNAESGGSHGDFRVGAGAAGANDPQFSQHAWLPMNGAGGAYGGKTPPLGSKDDPLYTSSAAAEDGSGSGQDAAQQLGSGFLGGIMQSVGLDGSVFKTFGGASNPLDFGATKMATGLLNWGMGMAQQKGGGRMPGMGGSIPGAAGLGESPTRGSGGYTQNNHIDNSMTVTQNGVQGSGVQPWAQANNSRTAPALAGPAFTGLP